MQIEENSEKVAKQKDPHDTHKYHGQIVLLPPAGLMVDRGLRAHGSATPFLPAFYVLVDFVVEVDEQNGGDDAENDEPQPILVVYRVIQVPPQLSGENLNQQSK